MEKICWGIIGCGNVTEVKSGPAFNKVEHSSLIAVSRRDPDKLADYVKRHDIPLSFTNALDLIQSEKINALYIATPPNVREAYAIEAMQLGKPVYLEKPMALNLAACKRLKAVSEKLGIKLSVAHYRRNLPLFMEVKNILEQGDIGAIKEVQITMLKKTDKAAKDPSNWRVDPSIAGGGYFYDLAPHQIDLVFYFFGKPKSFSGISTNKAGLYKAEDFVQGTIELENGIVCKGLWDFSINGEEKDEFLIIGEKGTIRFPVFGLFIEVESNGQVKTIPFEAPKHNQQNHIQAVVNYFLGKGENPCSAEDAILSMEVMESFVYGSKN
ncbi:MAG: Gfo/Idh/MocA family protein [Chitinophagaceae bacterium]|jgi:predicted dehydrogenase|nr:Gfo/Idh/MocA family oxidoreductase [Sediminibacterium sp.]